MNILKEIGKTFLTGIAAIGVMAAAVGIVIGLSTLVNTMPQWGRIVLFGIPVTLFLGAAIRYGNGNPTGGR